MTDAPIMIDGLKRLERRLRQEGDPEAVAVRWAIDRLDHLAGPISKADCKTPLGAVCGKGQRCCNFNRPSVAKEVDSFMKGRL